MNLTNVGLALLSLGMVVSCGRAVADPQDSSQQTTSTDGIDVQVTTEPNKPSKAAVPNLRHSPDANEDELSGTWSIQEEISGIGGVPPQHTIAFSRLDETHYHWNYLYLLGVATTPEFTKCWELLRKVAPMTYAARCDANRSDGILTGSSRWAETSSNARLQVSGDKVDGQIVVRYRELATAGTATIKLTGSKSDSDRGGICDQDRLREIKQLQGKINGDKREIVKNLPFEKTVAEFEEWQQLEKESRADAFKRLQDGLATLTFEYTKTVSPPPFMNRGNAGTLIDGLRSAGIKDADLFREIRTLGGSYGKAGRAEAWKQVVEGINKAYDMISLTSYAQPGNTSPQAPTKQDQAGPPVDSSWGLPSLNGDLRGAEFYPEDADLVKDQPVNVNQLLEALATVVPWASKNPIAVRLTLGSGATTDASAKGYNRFWLAAI